MTLNIPVNGAWVHVRLVSMGAVQNSTGNSTAKEVSGVSVSFTPDFRGNGWTGETTHRDQQGSRYALVSTWRSPDELYRRFTHVLVQYPKSIHESPRVWVFEAQKGLWRDIAAGEQWEGQRGYPDESWNVLPFTDLSPRETPTLSWIHEAARWHQDAKDRKQQERAWLEEQDLRPVEQAGMTDLPETEKQRLLKVEEFLNRELHRRLQTDAESMILRTAIYKKAHAPIDLILRLQIDDFRNPENRDFLYFATLQSGQNIEEISGAAKLYSSTSESVLILSMASCDSKIASLIGTIIVSLPDRQGSSALRFAVEKNSAFVDRKNWKFSGPDGPFLHVRRTPSSETHYCYVNDL